jgi:chromosome segregation ATPase
MIELVAHLEERVSKLITELEGCRQRTAQLESQTDELKITVADYERVRGDLAAAQEMLDSTQDLREQADAARAAASTLRHELEEARAARELAMAERDHARARTAEVEEWHRGVTTHRDEVAGQLELAQARIAELESTAGEAGSLRARLDDSSRRIAELEEWHSGACRHRDELKGQLDGAHGRIGELEGQLGEAEQVETLLNTLMEENADLKQRLTAADSRDERTRERLSMLIDRIEQAEQYISTVELAHEAVG